MKESEKDFLDEIFAGVILGGEVFVEEMTGKISEERLNSEIVQRQELAPPCSVR